MSPSPSPLSPSPRRWRPRSEEPHPDFAALLSTFEGTVVGGDETSRPLGQPSRNDQNTVGSSKYNNDNNDNNNDPTTPSRHITPTIRTISPSPDRPPPALLSPSASTRSSQGSSNPRVPAPRRYGDAPDDTPGRGSLTRGYGSRSGVAGPRDPSHSMSSACSSARRLGRS